MCNYNINDNIRASNDLINEINMIEEYIEDNGVAFLCNLAAPLIEFSKQKEIINL